MFKSEVLPHRLVAGILRRS